MTVMRRNSNLVIQSMQRRGSQNSKTSSNDQHQQHDSGSHIEGNGAASIDDATTTGNGGDSGGKGGIIDPAIVAAIRKARGGLEVESFFDSEKNESLASADNNKAPNKSGGESSVEISKTSNYKLESFTHSKKGDTVAEYKSDN